MVTQLPNCNFLIYVVTLIHYSSDGRMEVDHMIYKDN